MLLKSSLFEAILKFKGIVWLLLSIIHFGQASAVPEEEARSLVGLTRGSRWRWSLTPKGLLSTISWDKEKTDFTKAGKLAVPDGGNRVMLFFSPTEWICGICYQ